jgi:hypothetical protein
MAEGLSWSLTVGYSDFHSLMGFTSKEMANNILKMIVKTVFNWLTISCKTAFY